nr:EOG090X05V1 [Eurycercus lamellatus]
MIAMASNDLQDLRAESRRKAEEKLHLASELKTKGNAFFGQKNYKEAIRHYHKALMFVKGVESDGSDLIGNLQSSFGLNNGNHEFNGKVDPSVLEKNKQLKMDCYNNLSACLLQSPQPNNHKIMMYCKEVVEFAPKNDKAYFRLAQAQFNLGDFDEALKSCLEAQKILNHPNSKLNNLKLLCQIPDSTKKQLFSFGGLTKSYKTLSETVHELALMVRKPAVEVIGYLKETNFELPVTRYVLFGKMGAGKTMSLAHIIHYGSTAGYILVHVPWVPDWYRRFKEVAPSTTHPDAFLSITKNDWNNGAVVLSVDPLAHPNETRESYFPRYQLGKEGFEHIDPFIPIEVTNYSGKEIYSQIDYYIERKWLQQPKAATEKGRAELSFTSGNNPYTLMTLVAPY